MTAEVIDLNARRPKVYEAVFCLFCGTEHALVHIDTSDPNAYFGPCPGCDEEASVPLWRVVRSV